MLDMSLGVSLTMGLGVARFTSNMGITSSSTALLRIMWRLLSTHNLCCLCRLSCSRLLLAVMNMVAAGRTLLCGGRAAAA